MWPLSLTVSVRFSWADLRKISWTCWSVFIVQASVFPQWSCERTMRTDVRIGQRHRETTVGQSDEPQAAWDHVIELTWRRQLLLFSCEQEVKLDHSWQPHTRDRDGVVFIWSETVCPLTSSVKNWSGGSLSQLWDQWDWSLSSSHGNQELFIQSRTSAEVHLSPLVPVCQKQMFINTQWNMASPVTAVNPPLRCPLCTLTCRGHTLSS